MGRLIWEEQRGQGPGCLGLRGSEDGHLPLVEERSGLNL